MNSSRMLELLNNMVEWAIEVAGEDWRDALLDSIGFTVEELVELGCDEELLTETDEEGDE